MKVVKSTRGKKSRVFVDQLPPPELSNSNGFRPEHGFRVNNFFISIIIRSAGFPYLIQIILGGKLGQELPVLLLVRLPLELVLLGPELGDPANVVGQLQLRD